MYFFRDYDDINGQDLSISNDDYVDLIKLCIHNCKYFTLSFANDNIANTINKFLTPMEIRDLNESHTRLNKICIYLCSDEAEHFLTTYVNDLFDWVEFDGHNNPEDIAFYREDGSIFFWSETHEGICAIIDNDTEDVADIVEKHGWMIYDKNDCGIWRCLEFVEEISI